MKEPAHLLGQVLADLQALELGAERRAPHVTGVILERSRRGRFQMVDFGGDTGEIFFEGFHHACDERLLRALVVFFRQRDPILIVGVRRADDRVAVGPRPGVRIVEGIGAARHVHGVQGF